MHTFFGYLLHIKLKVQRVFDTIELKKKDFFIEEKQKP